VRFGELSFGERVLEALAAVGYDAFGIAVMGMPGRFLTTAVVEIVDRRDGQTVWRARDRAEAVRNEHDLIARELRTQDQAAFEAEWDLR